MSKQEELIKLLDVPEILIPYLNCIYTEDDIEIILSIKNRSLSKEELEKILNKDMSNAVENAYKNSVVNKVFVNNQIKYTVNSLESKMSRLASFERDKWEEINKKDREKISDWIFQKYLNYKKQIPTADLSKNGNKISPLKDVIKYLDTIGKDIYVIPCDCKSITEKCEFDRNVCISFGNEINSSQNRELGEKLTKNQAIDLLKHTEQEGLIHSIEKNAICNCCTCCCYPLRASRALHLKGKWPEVNYIISMDIDKCISCGICAKRCQLNVFEKMNKTIYMNNERCIGCGICTTSCPKNALKLKKLN
ncbi:4Fe-4S binding protein [Clostridium tyrobutyricum]|uniref:4Fe-4S binding protein n=1 Tax=Clostridium tyrobutyricum TaxID=1519 RepID=UPI001C387675|nr:4Fe-4S binding protein [Clostridium tyrobutyricum]MBV4428433.1 4Fe-4S binding protein [Clostridium tyrobutyricum]MBV4443361.1 4Fe-4S binding protein [Clostridium tyrobutyricum]